MGQTSISLPDIPEGKALEEFVSAFYHDLPPFSVPGVMRVSFG
jgi:hypothetical protein